MRLAAISSMARVIFLVAWTLLMRRRRMRSWPPATAALLRLEGLVRGGVVDPLGTGLGRVGVVLALARLEGLLELGDGAVEGVAGGQVLGRADVLEQVAVAGPGGLEELVFEAVQRG